MTQKTLYTSGDWIVHLHYGIGQVECTEEKRIGGSITEYYRVKTSDSIIWVPLEQADELFQPLATHSEVEQALEVLRRPARIMASNFNKRKGRINRVQSKNTLIPIARLVRDLWARRHQKGTLTNTEQDALRDLTDRLLLEWSVCMGVDKDEARQQMMNLLRQSNQKNPIPVN